jgi:UDP-glucuronate decarboxylase
MINLPEEDLQAIYQTTTPQRFDGSKVLLLGGSGFLGSILKRYFMYLRDAHSIRVDVISVDNYTGRNRPVEVAHPAITHHDHDLTLPLGLLLAGHKIDYIINCSGNASPASYDRFPLETMDISYLGTRHLLELALNHNAKILNFSSSEVLGTPGPDEIPTHEEVIPRIHSVNKRAPYDTGKLAIETLCWIFKSKYAVNVKVVRPFNVIGYFTRNDYRVVPNFMHKLLDGEKLTVFAPGTQTRTFCFYTDFISGCLNVLTDGNDLIYHIGNDRNEISIIDLAHLIEKTCGKSGLVTLVPTPEVYLHEPSRRCPSIEKARRELHYDPKVDLPTALSKIYHWVLKNRD